MSRIAALLIAGLAMAGSIACGGGGPAGPGGGTVVPRLLVNYAGFVGQSFSASVPTLCPTATCAVAPPAQTVVLPGAYTYTVADGATYVLQGTLIGRPGPLGPPATGVGSYLAFSLGWEPAPVTRLFGIHRSSVKLFLNDFPVATDAIFNGPACGHFMETFAPSVTTRWSYIFTVFSYTTSPTDLCS